MGKGWALTSLALWTGEAIHTGTSVGADAASTILAAVLAHSFKKNKNKQNKAIILITDQHVSFIF